MVNKITIYFKKKTDGDLCGSEDIEEGVEVEEKEVETSQPEPRCLAPASQNDWVCSSQVVPSLVVSVQNLSHVTHQTKQNNSRVTSGTSLPSPASAQVGFS